MKAKFILIVTAMLILTLATVVIVAQDSEYTSVTGVATDEGVDFPEEVPAGYVNVTFENNRSATEYTAGIARINEGVSIDQFMEAAAAENPMEAVSMITLYGGMGLAPGESTTYTLHLPAGEYLLLEFGEEGPSDANMFTVTENDMEEMEAPAADVNLALVDFGFGIPAFTAAGEQVWHVENVADQWHEVVVLPLPEGINSVADARAAMESPDQPDIQPVLFWAPMSPGTEAWITLDLEAGNYLLLCFLPDLNGDFSPHMTHGMMQVFTVE